jgi:hypothetical protein
MTQELTEGWRNLYSEKLHDVKSSFNTIRLKNSRRMRRKDMKHAWESEKHAINFVVKPQGKRPRVGQRRRWDDALK